MFKKARLRLTGWYLLIIMVVSLSFSLAIYRVLTRELDRFAGQSQLRWERWFLESQLPQFQNFPPPPRMMMDLALVAETKQRLVIFLVLINGGILLIAGGMGYILAGKTLAPIQNMVDEQNRFISDASHEFKTPLTSLKSAMEVSLRDKKFNLTEARTLISESIGEVNKLQSLTEGLLQLAQYQKPVNTVIRQKTALVTIVSEAVRKISPLARSKNISIVNNVRNYKIEGDKYALTDVLVILLDNAVKYSASGTSVSLSTQKLDHKVVISVRDEGIGIKKGEIAHIFKRFYRAETARSKQGMGGYGLGLSIAKQIIDNHQGEIRVTSAPGKGSVFKVILPLVS